MSARVLSGELKKPEINHLKERTILTSEKPVVVKHVPTEYSKSLKDVIGALTEWGIKHKNKITENPALTKRHKAT